MCVSCRTFSPTFVHVLPLLFSFGWVWTRCFGLCFASQQGLPDAQRLAGRSGRRLRLVPRRAASDTNVCGEWALLTGVRSYLPTRSCKPVRTPPPTFPHSPGSSHLPHQGVVLLDFAADEVMAGEGRVLKKERNRKRRKGKGKKTQKMAVSTSGPAGDTPAENP